MGIMGSSMGIMGTCVGIMDRPMGCIYVIGWWEKKSFCCQERYFYYV